MVLIPSHRLLLLQRQLLLSSDPEFFMLGATALVISNGASPLTKNQALRAKMKYGALVQVCDGIADNVEIQAAIDALPASGGIVMLSEGTFTITAAINVGTKYLTLQGAGRSATSIVAGANIATGAIRNSTGSAQNQLRLADFTYDGQKATYDTGSHGIDITKCVAAIIERVIVQNCVGSGLYASGTAGDSDGSTIKSCRFGSNDRCGAELVSVFASQIRGCYSISSGMHGLYLSGGQAEVWDWQDDGATDRGIYIESANETTLTGCSSSDGLSGTGSAALEIRTSDYCSIIGGWIHRPGAGNVTSYAVHITGSDYCTVQGLAIYDPGVLGGGGRRGIVLSSSSHHNTISGNTIDIANGQAFYEVDTADYNIYKDNTTNAAVASSFVGKNNIVRDNTPNWVTSTTGAIPVDATRLISIITAGAETRTLAAPTFIGQELTLYCKTYVGDCVVTCATTINETGNNTITFSATGQAVKLFAVEEGATLRWRCALADGATLSTV